MNPNPLKKASKKKADASKRREYDFSGGERGKYAGRVGGGKRLAGPRGPNGPITDSEDSQVSDDRELSAADFARAIPASVRKRLIEGRLQSGGDIVALRRFLDLTQTQFAHAMRISVHTLRNWEQDRRSPEGPALALLSIAARHPRILRESARSAA